MAFVGYVEGFLAYLSSLCSEIADDMFTER